MTRFEQLQHKANLCRQAAARTSGRMRDKWYNKALALEIMAANLPVVKASEVPQNGNSESD